MRRIAPMLMVSLCLVTFGLAMGCGGEDEEGEGQDNECEVRDQCEPDECGEVDDGCGGTLDCGECPCQDGQPQSETCGDCDLGILHCDDGETGMGNCEEKPEIPGYDGNCDELVFVSHAEGSPQGVGTSDDPVDTIDDALHIAHTDEAVALIVGGSETYDDPVVIEQQLSVIGGYDDHFVRDTDEIATILGGQSVDGLEDGDIVGLSSQGVSEEHRVSHLEVETIDVFEDGANNYGVYVYLSSGLVLEEVEVAAGRGGDGADGEDGANGEDGEDGGDGSTPSGISNDPSAGDGGENPGCSDEYTQGADGGLGGTPDDDPYSGFDSEEADGGSSGSNSGSATDRGGKAGENGPSASQDGEDGIGGELDGEVSEGRWHSLGGGEAGEDGDPGAGGGGGGGGGIDPEWTDDEDSYRAAGSGGGGGGAGGCGGQGGEGGQAGGGSFGLFVVAADIDVIESSIFANLGGSGGDGGLGGQGGAGGVGGESAETRGGVTLGSSTDYHIYERGGFGGDGGDGTAGGDGGGGAGGVSYGAYCSDAVINTEGTVRFNAGGSASGGSSPDGGSGEDGLEEDEYGCQ